MRTTRHVCYLATLLAALAVLPQSTARAGEGIEGPDAAEPGELVVLKATVPATAGKAWLRVPDGKNWLPVDNGKTVVFSTRRLGTYVFVLATANGDVPRVYQHAVKIADGPQPDPPDPNPPVPPPPGPTPTPDAKKVALDAAQKLPASARADAALMSALFARLAEKIPQDIPDAATLARATRGARALAMTPERDAAWDPWAAEVGEWVNKQGSLSMADYKRIWQEIAAGLKEVQ